MNRPCSRTTDRRRGGSFRRPAPRLAGDAALGHGRAARGAEITARKWPCSSARGWSWAAAIGGGEWLLGPIVTARYGGALLWLATLSILAQVVYNMEISRTRSTRRADLRRQVPRHAGPRFWLFVYLALDFGSVFPTSRPTPPRPWPRSSSGGSRALRAPSPARPELHRHRADAGAEVLLLLLAIIPLVFGGKVYNSLKAVMTFKILVVLGS